MVPGGGININQSIVVPQKKSIENKSSHVFLADGLPCPGAGSPDRRQGHESKPACPPSHTSEAVGKSSLELLDEMVQECAQIFEVENIQKSVDNQRFPYSDNNNQNRGGQSDIEVLEKELCKQFSCQKTAIRFLGCSSGLDYFYFISCMKWFCERCGAKGGAIHKKRLAGILKRVEGLLGEIALLQFVFTVPEEWRSMFLTRKAMNSLIRMAEKIIKKEYPEKRCVAYFHAFGEKKEGFNPHVNIHVIEEKGGRYAIAPERLQEIKDAWIKALKGYGCRGGYQGNIYYQFFTEKRKVLHKLSYMSRPCPGYAHVKQVRKSSELSRLFIVEMKGFSYIRYFNGFAYAKQKDVDRKEEVREITELAGERLKFVPQGEISRQEFDLKYMHWDYERLKQGFYRIKKKEKKKRFHEGYEKEYL